MRRLFGLFGQRTRTPGVSPTSLDHFRENAEKFETMGDRIVAYMKARGGIATRAEIAAALNISTSTMSGRVHALLKEGRLAEGMGRYTCTVTGNKVHGVYAN